MRKFLFIFTSLIVCSTAAAQTTDTLYILQTTDVHGQVYPYNYFKDQPASNGLAKIYTRIKAYRARHKNVIVLDGGDLLQGTPLVYYFNFIESARPNPMILALNFMQYDAFTVGNHDIEQGPAVYNRARAQSHFPWLSANALLKEGRPYFKPYTIIKRNGLTIGVLGLTTPAIPMWLDAKLYPGITWKDMIEMAGPYAKELRPKVDVLVGLFHAGFEANYSKKQTDALGLPNENASGLVAKQIPGFDVVFAGHSHRPKPKQGKETIHEPGKPLLLNAGSRARYLAVAQIICEQNPQTKQWRVTEKNGWLEPIKKVESSKKILDLLRPYHQETLKYIRTRVATLTDTLRGTGARFSDNPVVELINKAQMDYCNADISFAASFNEQLKIAPGPIQIKDIYGMYRYENFLYALEMTGRQIKDFLTYSAQYYIIKDGKVAADPNIPGYNYDMAEGIRYTIHVKRLAGAQVQTPNTVDKLIFIKTGKPLEMDRTYKVALNSYRATGGGGHLSAAKALKAPVVCKSDTEMRNILTAYFKKIEILRPSVDHNWNVRTGH